jgi:hypothetical protein
MDKAVIWTSSAKSCQFFLHRRVWQVIFNRADIWTDFSTSQLTYITAISWLYSCFIGFLVRIINALTLLIFQREEQWLPKLMLLKAQLAISFTI